MFERLGRIVSRRAALWLAAWAVLAALMAWTAPSIDEVVGDGLSTYLPADEPSRVADALYEQAFPDDQFGSNTVIVVRRSNTPDDQLLPADRQFVDDVLKPRILRIQLLTDLAGAYSRLASPADDAAQRFREIEDALAGLPEPLSLAVARDWHHDVFRMGDDPVAETSSATGLLERVRLQVASQNVERPSLSSAWQQRLDADSDHALDLARWSIESAALAGIEPPDPVIARVRTFSDSAVGHLLESADHKATLVLVQLTTEFLERGNKETIGRIERLISPRGDQPEQLAGQIPGGLDLALSGSATVGRDMRVAAEQSAEKIDWVTIVLVMILLVAIYRAPILALIPLVTVGIAVHIAIRTLALMADGGLIDLFSGIKIYITVVLYGAGVDYCMFLMARYKEELDQGAALADAMAHSIHRVGAALAASAGTTMVGIGMMAFAEFGKFQQAGIAMSFSLIFVLAASLTFTPAMLLLAGRWAFWPYIRSERLAAPGAWLSPTSLISQLMRNDLLRKAWKQIGQWLLVRPGTILLASVALMLPFAALAVAWFENRSYGLLTELPKDDPAVVGARAVQEHFAAGETGPVTVLVANDSFDFRRDGRALIRELSERLMQRAGDFGIADVRSVAFPLGMSASGQAAFETQVGLSLPKRAEARRKADHHYVSSTPELDGQVTRIDVVFNYDPFTRESIERFERFRAAVAEALPAELNGESTRLLYTGTTPQIRDLKAVTGRDQIRVDALVLFSVWLVLVLLLRRAAISFYLIVTVFFSYLVTLGVTFAVFYSLDPQGFAGLDWKVPMFLFTILIAVGEDYNIYLITRVEEEQLQYGPVQGVTVALEKTGKIISSCGLIMAGTFSSLLAASLVGMQQLGFALAFGVLLDTFIVRPILVPAWLILLNSGRFGAWGRFLGAQRDRHAATVSSSMAAGRKASEVRKTA